MAERGDFDIDWIDLHREPQCAPDPTYPSGIDIDCAVPGIPACKMALPYPAARCGLFKIRCRRCGRNVTVTTAGRPDDPRSITLACDRKLQ